MSGPPTRLRMREREAQRHSCPRTPSDGSILNETDRDQLVQASVAGVVVDVAAPPVAVMPVSEGREK